MIWVLVGERNSASPRWYEKQTSTNTHEPTPPSLAKARRIKLGIDIHADSCQAVRQIDHGIPQPDQKFTPKDFLVWARKQLALTEHVHSCYAAGPPGYGLHRALITLGIQNLVIRPQNRDELGKGVKTDRTAGVFSKSDAFFTLNSPSFTNSLTN